MFYQNLRGAVNKNTSKIQKKKFAIFVVNKQSSNN